MAHDIFISYSAEDKTVAEVICSVLESKHIQCWIAPRDVRIGAEWTEAIVDAIDESCIFVLVYSSSSNSSRQVVREVARAVSQGITIIPLRIDDAPLSKAMQFYIDRYQWLDAQAPPLKKHLQQLAQTIQNILTQERPVREIAQAPEEKQKTATSVEQPVLNVDCKRLDFTDIKPGSRVTRTFALQNTGIGKLTGRITTSQPWLKVLPDSVDLEKGRNKVRVTVDTTGLAPGFYGAGEIDIATNSGRAKITVGLSIATEAKPKPISKPKARMSLRWPLISLGAIFLVIAGVSGIYFIFGHRLAPSPPPAIQGVTVSDITATSAVIVWTTDKPATSQAEYGSTTDYGLATALDGELVTSHRVELTGLQPDATCHFRVVSKDAGGNEATSDMNQLTTLPLPPDTAPPVISQVRVAGYTGETATINWKTDKDAIGQVEYGTTNAYGKLAASDSRLMTSHSVELTGLQRNTTYHFQVKSTDGKGKATASGDNIFTTWVAEKGWKEYINKEYGFSLQYPEDWVDRPDISSLSPAYLAAFGIVAYVPGVVITANDADAPITEEWITAAYKATGNQDIRLLSPLTGTTLANGTKATTFKASYRSATGYSMLSYGLVTDADKDDKRIRVIVFTIDLYYPYNEAEFSQIAHTLRFMAEE